jgi:nitroimidazol reductase NimA-like FMN-containing flavoprotein (pyridoxamine 5'-phosphate oxidase superfamily)
MAINPTMSRAECEEFLAGLHVGVLSVAEEGRGPCTVPIWYSYVPGGRVRMTVGAESRKVKLLSSAGRASLCVQTETLPYRYVSVEGPIELVDTDVREDQRAIAVRYLGEKLAPLYLASMADGLASEVLLTLEPKRWWSVDFSKMKLG